MIQFAVLPFLLLSADGASWKLDAETDGIKVYGRAKEGSEVREMKAIGLVDATPQEMMNIINDGDSYSKVMPYVVESKILRKGAGTDQGTLYCRLDMPMVSGRDYIIELKDESDWKDGKGFLKTSWTSSPESSDALKPVPADVVRIRTNIGYWLLEPREEGKKTFATYYIYSAPGGSIPTFISNRANGTAVPKVFQAIKKAVVNARAKTK
jgi:Polyketide cyclase / dehydrase and lipid transport